MRPSQELELTKVFMTEQPLVVAAAAVVVVVAVSIWEQHN